MTVTDIEQRIIAIWTDVLGEEDIAPDDDFFDLGGSSIAAVRILPRICAEFAVEAEIGMVFDHPTPRELADALVRIAG
jgi:acyl carrier protein